ncbi:acyl carrier protein phosphodiesterase [Urechidicola sp. KH5]
MNFLAHLYLSPNDEYVRLGNFFADAVKGKNYLNYPEKIQKGILLHRAIDHFTDTHKIHKQSKQRLNRRYGHYKSVIIDLFYDHFLAKNWSTYATIDLKVFSESFYKYMHQHYDLLPEQTKYMLPYIEKFNWLYNYQYFEGMQEVLNGMNRRTKNKSNMHLALEDLKKKYTEFESDFTVFFEELIHFSENTYRNL